MRRSPLPLLVLSALPWLLVACGDKDTPDGSTATEPTATSGVDADGDGAVAELDDQVFDCDDNDASVYPGADDSCDGPSVGLDSDCDGVVDEDGVGAWFEDGDGDGVGGAPVSGGCDAPAGAVSDGGDCDDGDAGVFPGADEACDGRDRDCDGAVDEDAADALSFYSDGDGDGFGDATAVVMGCAAPADAVRDASDCDDSDGAVFPGADELCDGLDNDCDGEVDDPDVLPRYPLFDDVDGDGFGDPTTSRVSCDPTGGVDEPGDCDDTDPDIHPRAPEICDAPVGLDNDCDGAVDEDAWDATIWYADADSDGYGYVVDDLRACEAPAGYVDNARDCLDDPLSGGDVNPDGDEGLIGDGIDSDCDNLTDEGTDLYDDDGDGYSEAEGDCDDADTALGPDAEEDWDGEDQDCDGVVDEDLTFDIDVARSFLLGDVGDDAGSAVAFAGDVDGDGEEDLIIGGYTADLSGAASGGAFLVSGPIGGVMELIDATARLSGEDYYDYAGQSVAGAGDVNDDGYDDLIIGAPGNDHAASEGGRAYVLYGPVSGSLDLGDAADAIITGGSSDREVGVNVAGAGDVDDDGVSDLLVGLEDYGAALFLGPLTGELDPDADADARFDNLGYTHLGTAVAGAGDVDGDGFDDVFIGVERAFSEQGGVFLFSGPLSGDIGASDASASWFGPDRQTSYVGNAVAIAGDVDGDGYDDLIIGAPNYDTGSYRTGGAFLVLGDSAGSFGGTDQDLEAVAEAVIDGVGEYAYVGDTVAGVGDTNGDGLDDLMLSAPRRDLGSGDQAGVAYLLLSPVSGSVRVDDAERIYEGLGTNDYLGQGIAGGRDLDGDGLDDVLVGMLGYSDSDHHGAVFILPGGLP